nr:protein O-linked-mannose beta-1,2-N-acetylglucosaminyltransferase 1-like [Cherax quadricarinatus]
MFPSLLNHYQVAKLEAEMFRVQVLISYERIEVYRDHTLIYERTGVLTHGFKSHAGVHVVVLHPTRGHIMLSRQFITHQPAEYRNLVTCLQSLLPGRILVVAAVPEALAFLPEEAAEQLEAMGSSMIRNLATFEAWAMVSHTPSSTHAPSITLTTSAAHFTTTLHMPRGTTATPSIHMRSTKSVPSSYHHIQPSTNYEFGMTGVWCRWHEDPSMQEQRDFCDTYEGYLKLCMCNSPITPAFRHSAPEIKMNETIPVAMLTAIKPFNFYRQLLNLLETPGASQTPILVMVDGYHEEVIQLARLFRLDVLVHRPQGEAGSSTLLNMHFRFSVHNVFNFFPEVDKAIILEDDLLLSPDFLSFFQQTAWLLDADPTIHCVNSFSVNSYPEVAHDPTVLRRLEMFPQFGWMIKRQWAREQYERWIPEKETADWDWWLSSEHSMQGRHALVPEVGRSFHAGAAGAHVTGWAQEHIFNHMIYNQNPHVKLKGLEDLTLHRYEAKMKREILAAQEVHFIQHPCSHPFLPQDQPGPFKLFVASDTKSDEYGSYYVMQLVSTIALYVLWNIQAKSC